MSAPKGLGLTVPDLKASEIRAVHPNRAVKSVLFVFAQGIRNSKVRTGDFPETLQRCKLVPGTEKLPFEQFDVFPESEPPH